MGLLVQASQERDRFAVDDVTQFLFANNEEEGEGSDLMARNIQRGR